MSWVYVDLLIFNTTDAWSLNLCLKAKDDAEKVLIVYKWKEIHSDILSAMKYA